MRTILTVGLTIALVAGAAAVGASPAAAAGGGRMQVVVAENFWGSIVRQLAGTRATVTSIISKPQTDPHDYEPTPSDARAIASARYVVVNGIGYDPWAQKLIDADPEPGRRELDVGKLLGVPTGGNPHQWYSPTSVERFVDRVTADLTSLDKGSAGYFAARRAAFETMAMAAYHASIADIRRRFGGTPVGASESIFTPMARALDLRLITPSSFLTAVAEGADPTAQDKAMVDRQVAGKQIKVFVFNAQNATPDVQAVVKSARAEHIPVTRITETLTPANVTFQSWQVRQLHALERALATATGT
jgi:zinc/manganese transport system substrate-binding protein